MRIRHPHGTAEITSLPGCADVAVITAASVDPAQRGKGLGTAYNAERIRIARQFGYEAVMCTANLQNDRQMAVLKKNGWTLCHKYYSKRTSHWIGIFIRTTNEYEDPQS